MSVHATVPPTKVGEWSKEAERVQLSIVIGRQSSLLQSFVIHTDTLAVQTMEKETHHLVDFLWKVRCSQRAQKVLQNIGHFCPRIVTDVVELAVNVANARNSPSAALPGSMWVVRVIK